MMYQFFPASYSSRKVHARAALLPLIFILFCVCPVCMECGAAAQEPRARPGQTVNSSTAQRKSEKKNVTALSRSDTPEGPRLSLTTNGPLNDYSAYRMGDRFYVIIPKAEASAARSSVGRGRGMGPFRVEKRGEDLIISFRLQPGTSARVSQKFNKLDVQVETSGATVSSSNNTGAATAKTATAENTAGRQATESSSSAASALPSPAPTESAASNSSQPVQSTGATTEQTPAATQVAQAQQNPATPVATPQTVALPASTTPARSWFPVLIAAIVLLTVIGLIWLTRSRREQSATPNASTTHPPQDLNAQPPVEDEQELPEEIESHVPTAFEKTEAEDALMNEEDALAREENAATHEEHLLSHTAVASSAPVPLTQHNAAEASQQPLSREPLIEAVEAVAEDLNIELSKDADYVQASTVEAEDGAPVESASEQLEIDASQAVAEPHAHETEMFEPAQTDSYAEHSSSQETVSTVAGDEIEPGESEDETNLIAPEAGSGGAQSLYETIADFDDASKEVRERAARALYEKADRVAAFTHALRETDAEARRRIGAAFASSGLAAACVGQLSGTSPERAVEAFSLLFLMLKAGELQPLLEAIEEHPNTEVRLAVIRLLALSEQPEILPQLRRLLARKSLPTPVRSALMQTIYQLNSQT